MLLNIFNEWVGAPFLPKKNKKFKLGDRSYLKWSK